MNKHRTLAQDAAKGLMIIAVIFFHCYLTTFAVPVDALSQFSLLSAFFPFLLSSFFFYAGYNYTPNERTSVRPRRISSEMDGSDPEC